jgi:hypothetical protein
MTRLDREDIRKQVQRGNDSNWWSPVVAPKLNGLSVISTREGCLPFDICGIIRAAFSSGIFSLSITRPGQIACIYLFYLRAVGFQSSSLQFNGLLEVIGDWW